MGRQALPTNVVGLLRASGSDGARAVLIGGHLDGVGTDPNGAAFPAANDNASGPAVTIEVARVLAAHRAMLKNSFVFAANELVKSDRIENAKVKHHKKGGWSQARFQRHVEKFHRAHVKELVDTLQRIMRDEGIDRVLLAGDEVVIPLVREALPKTLAERVVEIGNLDLVSSEAEFLEETLDVARREDARDDAERVARMLDAYRAGGLGMIGVPGVTAALENGQVHELLVVADPSRLEGADGAAIADALVAKARQTGARVTFIEDAGLLAEGGGVGALLRFRLHRRAA